MVLCFKAMIIDIIASSCKDIQEIEVLHKSTELPTFSFCNKTNKENHFGSGSAVLSPQHKGINIRSQNSMQTQTLFYVCRALKPCYCDLQIVQSCKSLFGKVSVLRL